MILKQGSRGSLISLLQLGLERSGFAPGPKDGIYGPKTTNAVIEFQKNHGLVPDGIAGPQTLLKIRPYLVGYTTYTIKPGDTLYNISRRLYSTVPLIENANGGLDALNLTPGTNIIVPYNFSLTPTDIPISSLLCELICEGLAVRYPFIYLSAIGRSAWGKTIPALRMGKGQKKVFLNASHHANEWITTQVVLKYVEEYAKAVVNAENLGGANSEYMFDKNTLYIVPMVNPDGVDLVTGALTDEAPQYIYAKKISENYPQISFPQGWKANLQGTDLNLNYPALWERARQIKFSQGFTSPAPRDFVGPEPLSAPESRAVLDYTRQNNFNITISFHTQGEEIYWQFENYADEEALRLGIEMANASGYKLTSPEEGSSYAGYKDWFLMEYRRPGYTIEAGKGINPLPIYDFWRIYPQCAAIITTSLIFDEER